MIKSKGFLMSESMIALIIAFLGVTIFALVVGESRENERNLESKTDRTYAWHVMKKNNLKEVKVHDHVYQPAGNGYVYDTNEKKEYHIEK